MSRLVVVSATAVAALVLSSCKKVEPVTAAPIPAPAGAPAGAPAMPPPGGQAPAMPPPSLPPPGMPPPQVGQQMPGNLEAQIAVAKKLVEQDPKNVRAWISLGNDYFDSRRFQESIDAYAKALELDPNNPDVLTDQGVMYRELGKYDKALANFLKANQVAPRHFQSLFNAGVVYAFDLKDQKKAVEAWNKIIATDPASPFANQARQAIQDLQSGPARGR